MANKITQEITLKVAGVSSTASITSKTTIDQVGTNYTEETQLITSSAAVQLDIGTSIPEGQLGYLLVKNLDTANPIDIATDEAMTNKIATIAANNGSTVSSPGGTTVLWALATTADVQIVFLAIQT